MESIRPGFLGRGSTISTDTEDGPGFDFRTFS